MISDVGKFSHLKVDLEGWSANITLPDTAISEKLVYLDKPSPTSYIAIKALCAHSLKNNGFENVLVWVKGRYDERIEVCSLVSKISNDETWTHNLYPIFPARGSHLRKSRLELWVNNSTDNIFVDQRVDINVLFFFN